MARIGYVCIGTNDYDRATAFYTRYFSLQLVERVGDAYVFLTGGEYHHEIALQNVGAFAPECLECCAEIAWALHIDRHQVDA